MGQHRDVGHDVRLGHVAGRVQRLAVGDGDAGAGRAEPREADPAVEVLPEVDDLPARTRRSASAGSPCDPPDRGSGERHERPERQVGDDDRAPLALRPGMLEVERLALDQVRDVAGGCRAPGRVRARGRSAPPSASSSSSCASSPVAAPHWSAARKSPTWPRHQPSETSTASSFTSPGDECRTSNVWTCRRCSYWRVARGQLRVADADAVQVRLVEAVRRDVQPAPGDRAGCDDRAAQPVRGPVSGGRYARARPVRSSGPTSPRPPGGRAPTRRGPTSRSSRARSRRAPATRRAPGSSRAGPARARARIQGDATTPVLLRSPSRRTSIS